jgi:hypothetical protein
VRIAVSATASSITLRRNQARSGPAPGVLVLPLAVAPPVLDDSPHSFVVGLYIGARIAARASAAPTSEKFGRSRGPHGLPANGWLAVKGPFRRKASCGSTVPYGMRLDTTRLVLSRVFRPNRVNWDASATGLALGISISIRDSGRARNRRRPTLEVRALH